MSESNCRKNPEPIAIVGIGCKLPGGIDSPENMWKLLCNKREAIQEVPADRWSLKAHFSANPETPGHMNTRWGGFIDSLDQFDASFFGISPREAKRIDPQHRWLLEVAHEAFEDSCTPVDKVSKQNIGVFIGISSNDYASMQAEGRRIVDLHTNSGSALSIAANRISYQFDLRGPSIAVDTACSSSLVAIHLACQSIWNGESSMALTGGVNALLSPELTIGFSKAGMLSPTGKCYAFDSRANGYVRSEGAAIVFLKLLSRALADGDTPYALIRATVVNQDGHTSGMTVPSVSAQEEMIRQAYILADIAPERVRFIEAHGTGTQVGDPVEAHAIAQALCGSRSPENALLLGSIKTNLGHLESASGVAGVIKTALILKHRSIVPNLNYERPNPNIEFEKLVLRVPTRLESLDPKEPIIAGVNSFGFGGTNAHLVLEEYRETSQKIAAPAPDSPPYILPLSAKSSTSFKSYAEKLAEQLLSEGELSLGDLGYNAACHRSHYRIRDAIVADSRETMREKLLTASGTSRSETDQNLIFLFTGQGPQWSGMGRELFATEPIFRVAIEECDKHFRALGSSSLLSHFLLDTEQSRIDQTEVAQPTLFALQVGLVCLLRSWGISPKGVVGHSLGEVAAAHTAGLYSLKDSIELVFHRSRLQQRTHGQGKMISAAINWPTAQRIAQDSQGQIEIAAYNSSDLVTLAGDPEAIDSLLARFHKEGIFVRDLLVDYAFHTAQMDPLKDELYNSLSTLRALPPKLEFYSTVEAALISKIENSPEYWWRNIREPVKFSQTCDQVVMTEKTTFVEIGPHPTLVSMIRKRSLAAEGSEPFIALSTLHRDKGERLALYETCAGLYKGGFELNWESIYHNKQSRKIKLPKYPWERTSYWIESEHSRTRRFNEPVHPLLGYRVPAPGFSWVSTLDLKALPYLRDHRVEGAVMLPASAFIELGFAACRELGNTTAYGLKDFAFLNGLYLFEDEEVQLHSHFNQADQTFSVYSTRSARNSEWTLHATAQIERRLPPSFGQGQDNFEILCDLKVSSQAFYQNFDQVGYNYGPQFQLVHEIGKLEQDRVVGEVAPPLLTPLDHNDYIFHPSQLDCCLQCLRGIQVFNESSGNDLFIPIKLKGLAFYSPPNGKLFSDVKLRHENSSFVEADIRIRNADRSLVAEIHGFRCRSLGRRESRGDNTLYIDTFIPTSYEALETEIPSKHPARYLILSDSGDIGRKLSHQLNSLGTECLLVEADQARQIDTLSLSLHSQGLNFTGVISLSSLGVTGGEGLEINELQDSNFIEPLHLVQMLGRQSAYNQIRLWFITQSRTEKLAPSIVAAPLWGFARVALNEAPHLRPTLIDIDDLDTPSIKLLAEEIIRNGMDHEVMYRAGNRYVSRLKPSTLSELPPRAFPMVTTGNSIPYKLTIEKVGSLKSLRNLQDRRTPPKSDEVEIRVHSAGVNFRDVMKAMGLYPGELDDLDSLGDECAGTVIGLGEQVRDISLGDEVIVMTPGTFRSHLTVSSQRVFKRPPTISIEEGATIPVAFLTASYALEQVARLKSSESVLIHAGAGGVGLAAIQIAKLCGATIYATAGSETKRDYLRSLGIQHVMDSRSLHFVEQVLKLTSGRGVDVVLNSLSGEFMARSMSLLSPGGRFVELGKRDIFGGAILPLSLFKEGMTFCTIDLAKSISEYPEQFHQLNINLLKKFEEGLLLPLPVTKFMIGDAEEAFRYMSQGKHIGKLVLTLSETPPSIFPEKSAPLFAAQSSYLIVGGMGGFGLELAKWLACEGAKHLVLMGRHGASTLDAISTIHELRSNGVEVVIESGDVSNEADVNRVLQNITETLPPLKGIFHCAMTVDTGLINDLSSDRFSSVLAPKISGAWNLHKATALTQLDYFVLFSSASSLLGGVGHASYAAANAFLDGLAHYRHSIGRPALAVNWGLIKDVGYVARDTEVQRYFEQSGIEGISSTEALKSLAQILRTNTPQIGVMKVNWDKLAQSRSSVPNKARLQEVIGGSEATKFQETRPGAVRATILSHPQESREELLMQYLSRQVSRVSGAELRVFDPHTTLPELGIDSLMTFQLKLEVDRDLAITIDPTKLIQTPNLQALARELLALISESEAHDHLPDPIPKAVGAS